MLGWIFLYVVAFHKICKSGQTLVDVVLIELKRLKVSSFFFFFLRHLLQYSKDKMLYLLLQLEINRGLAWWGREGNWHPTPVLLPGKSHGWRSLVGCSPCGR